MMSSREEIANAFERHFHHFGFRKTSVDDVARELKISKKTIYANFDSKEEIFQYLVTRASTRLLQALSAELAALPSFQNRLEGLVHALFQQALRFTLQRGSLDFQLEIAEAAFREAYRHLLSELLAGGLSAREFTLDHVDVSVTLIDGLIAAGLRLAAARPTETEVVSTIEAATVSAVLKIAG